MDCSHATATTAWPCSTRRTANGQEVLVVAPPVSFWDGSIVPLYVLEYGENAHITDDGGLLQHLESSGFRLTDDTRRQIGLRRALEKVGAYFTNELTVVCRRDNLRSGFNTALAALFAARHWEDENAGRLTDARLLMSETESYLRILSPAAAVKHDVELVGISGRKQVFPLALDQEIYEAVSPHPVSSAAMTKKLFDVRSVREQRDVPITIVLDDRGEAERVRQDTSLLSQLAHIERFTQIRARALGAVSARH